MPSSKIHFRCSPQSNGYVLLMTLVLLALAATAAVSISRAALSRVQAASEALGDLQRRWTVLSGQAALLPKVETLLQRSESAASQPLWSVSRTTRLGGDAVSFVFADESSKASLTTLIATQGRVQAELTARQLCLGNPRAAGSVHLRLELPLSGPQTFDDVFDPLSIADLLHNDLGAAPAVRLTCWGDGRLNIHRASREVLIAALGGTLNLAQCERLLALQHTAPKITLPDALDELQLAGEKRDKAGHLLADRSTCSSVWINIQTPRRSDWTLAVRSEDRTGQFQLRRFEW